MVGVGRVDARLRKAARALGGMLVGRGRLGECPICNSAGSKRTIFVQIGPSPREHTLCIRCRSNARNRAVMLVMQRERQDWRTADILEGGAGGPLSRALSIAGGRHVASQLLEGVPRGETHEGIRSEDLQSLTLTDGSVDLVVTEDVLEHVWEPDRAFGEIARVLRQGGAHIFTVPYHRDLTVSRRRVRVHADTGLEYLEVPTYHDDPLDVHGVLVATDWGTDLPVYIESKAGTPTTVLEVIDPVRGIFEPCAVMVSRKL